LEMTLLVKVRFTLSIVANFQNGDQQKTSNTDDERVSKFQLQRPSTYAQESIFSLTNHSAIVCDSTSVTIPCDSQNVQTSQQRQRPTQYAHMGDFTMGQPTEGLRPTIPSLRPAQLVT